MVTKAVIAVAFLSSPVWAQSEEFISDAFGFAPDSAVHGTARSHWAGLQESVASSGSVKTHHVAAGTEDTVLAFVGPKSAVAGKDPVHAVAIGLDQNGNLLPDGIAVTFELGQGVRPKDRTRFGVADTLFTPLPRTGVFHTGAETGKRQSARAEFRVVPDLGSVQLVLDPLAKESAPESFTDVRTGLLKDRFGNPVGDGVAVQIKLTHADGATSVATGLTIADAARAYLLTRGLGSPAELTAVLGASHAAPVAFSVAPLRATVAPDVTGFELESIGAIRFRVGPFLTSAGHMLNDGAPISVALKFRDKSVTKLDGWVRDGMFEAIAPGLAKDLPATLEITSETGRFKLRLDALDSDGPRPNWGLE